MNRICKASAGFLFGIVWVFGVMASTPPTPNTLLPLFLVSVAGIWIAGVATGIAIADKPTISKVH